MSENPIFNTLLPLFSMPPYYNSQSPIALLAEIQFDSLTLKPFEKEDSKIAIPNPSGSISQ